MAEANLPKSVRKDLSVSATADSFVVGPSCWLAQLTRHDCLMLPALPSGRCSKELAIKPISPAVPWQAGGMQTAAPTSRDMPLPLQRSRPRSPAGTLPRLRGCFRASAHPCKTKPRTWKLYMFSLKNCDNDRAALHVQSSPARRLAIAGCALDSVSWQLSAWHAQSCPGDSWLFLQQRYRRPPSQQVEQSGA